MPIHTYTSPLASTDLMPHATRLPIPKAHVARGIPARHHAPIRADCHIDRISGVVMPSEALLPVLPEPVAGAVDDNLVVGGLESDVLAAWVRGAADHGEHFGFGDVFDGDRDIVFPGAEALVVGGGDEAAVGVAEGDCVDRAEVVVVLLHGFLLRCYTCVELDYFLSNMLIQEKKGSMIGRN